MRKSQTKEYQRRKDEEKMKDERRRKEEKKKRRKKKRRKEERREEEKKKITLYFLTHLSLTPRRPCTVVGVVPLVNAQTLPQASLEPV